MVTVSLLNDDKSECAKHGAARWQRSDVDPALAARLAPYEVSIVEDVADARGLEFVPNSHCGAFPHAVARARRGKGAAREYLCSASHDVVITVQLTKRGAPTTERALLGELGDVRGHYEERVSLYAELQFDADHQDAEAARVHPYRGAACSFATPVDKLFSPAESIPYAGGTNEVDLLNGRAELQFSLAKGAVSTNLRHRQPYRIAVFCLNPYMAHLQTRSRPFFVKHSFKNFLRQNERYVLLDGVRVPVSAEHVLRSAPKRKFSAAVTLRAEHV